MVRVSINLRNIEPSEYRPITHLPSRCWMRQRAREYVSSACSLEVTPDHACTSDAPGLSTAPCRTDTFARQSSLMSACDGLPCRVTAQMSGDSGAQLLLLKYGATLADWHVYCWSHFLELSCFCVVNKQNMQQRSR